MMEREAPAALVVDDDEALRRRLCRAFQIRGWEAAAAADGPAALALARDTGPDLAIVDLRLPEQSGLEIVRNLRAIDATMTIIMLTGYGSIATALEAMRCGADHYLTKPVDVDQVLAAFQAIRGGQVESVRVPSTVPSLARVEWEHIQRVLADCGGNVSQAAKLLGMHRRSLQRKLSKYPSRS
ncbi:MAG: response regulator [Acidobacteria bacterium]|nr:response regulator [Acidobacteriota bacterium]